jgi:hypothetical protein
LQTEILAYTGQQLIPDPVASIGTEDCWIWDQYLRSDLKSVRVNLGYWIIWLAYQFLLSGLASLE